MFEQVSLVLSPGTAVAVVGPDRAGKSTFLRCVLGWESRDEGEVLLDGRPLDESGAAVLASMSAGATWMDTTLVSGVLEERRLRPVATVRSRRRSGGGRWRTLLAADLCRALRCGPALALL